MNPSRRWLRVFRLAFCAGLIAAGLAEPRLAAEAPESEVPPAPPVERSPADEPPEGKRFRAARIPLEGAVNQSLLTSIERRAEQAIEDGCKILIFEVSSYGGYVTVSLDLSKAMERFGRRDVRTVAYVEEKAISAAAMAAMSCQEIVVAPEAQIGNCAPILVGPDGVTPLTGVEREKQESVLRDRMAHLSEQHGIPPAVGKAMVTMGIVVVKAVNAKTGEVRYVEEDEIFNLPDAANWEKKEIVDGSNEILTASGRRAKELGIAKHVVGDFDELYDIYRLERPVALYSVTTLEVVAGWLNNPALKSLLVLIGLIGAYVELSSPGFGVPGTIGLLCFALVFIAPALAGNTQWVPAVFFGIGLVLLALEVFVTPGFGVLGSLGVLGMLAGIVLALPRESPIGWDTGVDWNTLGTSALITTGIVAVFLLVAAMLGRFLPQLPVLGRLVLAPSSVSDGSSRAAAARIETGLAVGQTGRTLTKLRPAGKIMIDDRLVDATTEGDYLDAEQTVEVVEVRGNRVVVAPKETPAEEGGA
jgi:membrane-bound serine protease (ClpP class)